MTKPLSRKTPWGALFCLFMAMFLVAGCGPVEQKAAPYEGTVNLPVPAPPTFVTKGSWQARTVANASVVTTPQGVLTMIENTNLPADSYQVALLDPRTGKPRWSSAAILSPNGVPSLAWTTVSGRSWAIVTVPETEHRVSVYAYDGGGGSETMPATSSKRFSGTDAAAPRVIVGDGGVLVTGVGKESLIYFPDSGGTSAYGKGPEVGGEAGVPVLAYGTGFVTVFPAGGFAYASEAGGWVAKPPAGAKVAGARYLSTGNGIIIAAWPTSATTAILAAHRLSDGTILAQMPLDNLGLVTDAAHSGAKVVMAQDGSAVAYANMLLSLTTGKGEVLDLRGAHIVSISRGIAYAKGAKAPLFTPTPVPSASTSPSGTASGNASTSASTTPSTVGTASVTSTASGSQTNETAQSFEFTGDVAMDIETKAPLAGKYGMVPSGFTSLGEGIFTTSTANQSVFSVAVR